MTTLLKFLVVSDIHAFGRKEKSTNSVLDYSPSANPPPNPLRDLIKLAQTGVLKADVLICAGDISNQADASGLVAAWKDLQELAKALGNAALVATNGNHDLDSRFLENEKDPDPKGALLGLDPPFPFADSVLSNHYWARNFALVPQSSDVMMAVLNTSAFHGGKQSEIDHGRVSRRTITELCRALEDAKGYKAHVLVCHHHPLPLDGWAGGDDMEYIRNGHDLLTGLLKATSTSWLVVHGHRHLPRLVHGASDNNDVPFVFGVGSLGARMTGVANQFHVVTLHAPPENDHASITGVVETWFWSDSIGWTFNSTASGLPAECGFGYRGQVKGLVSKIIQMCATKTYVTWQEVVDLHPGVRFLMPDSLNILESELGKSSISILRDRNGRIVQVGK
jgi:3',5'-cyclic AMP phosphodiesterase CpdA